LAAVFSLGPAADPRHLVRRAWYHTRPTCPIDVSGQGAGVDQLIIYVHILMGVLFVGWIGYFFYVIMRFHKSRNPKADYVGVTSHASTYAEVVVAIVEAVLLIGFAIPVWSQRGGQISHAKRMPSSKSSPSNSSGTAGTPAHTESFAPMTRQISPATIPSDWTRKTPTTRRISSSPKILSCPWTNRSSPISAPSMSSTVLPSKPMRVTQDAIPGMVIPAHFTPKKLGTYQINCAQLCGMGHYTMRGTIKVVSQAEYDKWVAEKSKSSGGTGGGYE
jgi:cytochrome c oxidase subunit II